MADSDKNWDFYLRTLSASARDSTPPSSDPSLLQSVKKLCELCKAEKSDDLVARVYPSINRLFQRCIASIPQSGSSHGILLLAILNFSWTLENLFFMMLIPV
ncbi:DNA topoisomerase 3-alpha [Bienertia sinuspersici]